MNNAVGRVLNSTGKRHVSIGAVLDRTNGIGQGFDTLRIILSIAILCWHSIVTSYGREAELPFWTNPLTGGVVTSLLPIFFALSGFLVMGSAVRTMSLKVFLAARGLRILPALATEVTMSAVILGSLVTTLSPANYFTNIDFFRYFGSLVGNIQISLPGVFSANPFDNVVNSSLWTIAPEILCYTYIAFVIAVGLLGKPRGLSLLIVTMTVISALSDSLGFGLREIGGAFRPHTLILAFAIGNLLFLWRNFIPFSLGLFALCLVAGMALVSHPSLATLATPPLVYVTVYLGLLPLPKIPLLDRGDYSYGIYLYAMPVQQSFAYAFPQLRQWVPEHPVRPSGHHCLGDVFLVARREACLALTQAAQRPGCPRSELASRHSLASGAYGHPRLRVVAQLHSICDSTGVGPSQMDFRSRFVFRPGRTGA